MTASTTNRQTAGSTFPPNAPPAFHVLIKPTGAICNLDCKYCFFLSKEMLYPGSRFQMAEDLLETYLKQLLETHRAPDVAVAWQGGEPTLMGLDFFKRSVELVNKFQRPGQQIQYTIQSNGTLLNDATGQYDGTKLVNNGANRWAFKPELGYSRPWGHWVLDAYGAVWFFTTNPVFWSHNQFNPGTVSQSQAPIGAFEGHLSYDVKARLWVSLDNNLWFRGRISLNGVENPQTQQLSSLIGGTISVPVSKHQSLKVGINTTDYVRYGGNYENVSVAWQYSWLGRPN